ncbi:MAG: hypothetical protein ABI883_01155 [Chthoniobacterales bacterium]
MSRSEGEVAANPGVPGEQLNVLILGDSLALCGFGKRLDERFRNDPRVRSTFTYMACGTNPLSWLKHKPYEHVKTQCGFWSIESDGSGPPRELQDTYGMRRNQAPKAHLVPKIEDLLMKAHPDIIVVQTGSNLFGLFPDSKTVRPTKDASTLKNYLVPFREKLTTPPSRLRRIYYVNPPTSGRTGAEVQDFVLAQTEAQMSGTGLVIDSRKLVSYPYRHMDPDKEHFLGADMDEWADKVFALIDRDLSAQPLAALRPLSETTASEAGVLRAERAEVAARAEAVPQEEVAQRAVAVTPPAEPPKRPQPLQVRARLVFKSQPIPLRELLPYRESLVAFVYEIEQVQKGAYNERLLLVMHPAHIATKEQRLDKFRIGKRYKLRLDRLEGTLWETAKARDESNQINLLPYMLIEDLKKHPGSRTR